MRKNILKKGIAYLCVLALAITMLFPSFDVYAQGEETNSGYDTIRVATMNLQVTEDTDMAEVNEVLKENKVDVVGLQEVDKENGRNNYDMLKALSDFGDYPYHFFQKAIDYKSGEYGIGIASKHELLDSDGANYEKGDVKEERAWERTHILYGDKEITVYNTHLTHESEAERKKELEELLKIFDADNSRYKVLTGDFNTDQGYYENYPFMRKYQTVNGHAGIWYDTCTEKEEDMKVAAIDNIIATRNLEIENIQTVSVDFSDHDMLYADLGFRDSDGVYFDLLNFLIDDAEKVDTSIYTDETMQMLQSALEKAKELDETVSQDEIDKNIKEIETAMEGLEVRNPNLASVSYTHLTLPTT